MVEPSPAMLFVMIGFVLLYGPILRWLINRRKYVQQLNALPGPKSYPLIGSMHAFVGAKRGDLPRLLRENFADFPYISRSWLGPIGQVELKRAEHVEIILSTSKHHLSKAWAYKFVRPWLLDGLLTSSGAKWHKHRKIITPAFHFTILENFCEIFCEHSQVLVHQLKQHADTDQPFDIYPYITKATLDMIAEAAMGTKLRAQNEQDNPYVNAVYETSELIVSRLIRPWLYPDCVYKLTGNGQKFAKSIKLLHSFTEDVIRQRRNIRRPIKASASSNDPNPKKRLAFLDLLLDTCDEGSHDLSDEDVRAEVDTFMFEGHDTTTAAISWALLLLALHPTIQEDAYDELMSIFGDSDRTASVSDLNEMRLLDRIIKETLRLYPSVPNIGRTLSEDVRIDDYILPTGCTVTIEIVHLHRDERFFPDAETFNPDRFLLENIVDRHPYAYLPFSAGPRNCIGQKFAMFEEKAILSTLLRSYRFKTPVVQRQDVKEVYELILRPIDGISITLESRNK